MKDVIKKVPIPLCGVMLGAAALGIYFRAIQKESVMYAVYSQHFF